MRTSFRVLGLLILLAGIVVAVLPGETVLRDTRDLDTAPDAVNAHVPFRVAMLLAGMAGAGFFWWLAGRQRRPPGDDTARRRSSGRMGEAPSG